MNVYLRIFVSKKGWSDLERVSGLVIQQSHSQPTDHDLQLIENGELRLIRLEWDATDEYGGDLSVPRKLPIGEELLEIVYHELRADGEWVPVQVCGEWVTE